MVRWSSWLGGVGGVLLLAGFAHLAVETPPLLFAAALLPAAACVAGVIALDRRTHARRRLLAAFLCGVLVAPAVALALNDALAGRIGAAWIPTFAAPAVEETAKAAPLLLIALLWRDEIDRVAAGIVYGALIGIGFTMTENLFYFPAAVLAGGPTALVESVYLRAALGGLRHAAFTATTGAGVGWGRSRGGAARLVGPLVGLTLALAQHIAWNAVGAAWLNQAACGPGAAACPLAGRLWYWLVTAPGIVALFIAPALAALLRVSRPVRSACAVTGGDHVGG